MGEIKSTLDLVLEKTRHLTLSEEEKQQQKYKELRKRLAGLLQRYQDGKLDIGKLGEELDRLVQGDDGPGEASVCEEVIDRIELGSDNGPWLALLQTRYELAPSGVQSVEEDFGRAIEASAAQRKEEIKKELQQLRRISGSAVVPNLQSDRTWSAEHQTIAADFRVQLTAALDEMKNSLAEQ